jgi:hypothetical protein
VDPKSPLTADAAYLFTNAQKNLVDHNTSSDVNNNIGRLLAQYWSQVTYTNESRYDIENRNIPQNHWHVLYRDVLMDLKESRNLINDADEKVKANKLAIISILEIYTYQWLVDTFGDVPYSEALQGLDNPTPAYDDAKTIYSDLLSRINTAINDLDASAGSFGSADLMYGGNAASWKTFANSLKLRLAIRIIEDDFATASAAIIAAEAGAFTANSDNATLDYLTGTTNGNPLYNTLVVSGRHDYVPSNTLVDYMNNLNDPRRGTYMTQKNGAYVGLTYGGKASAVWGDYSQIADAMKDPEYAGVLMDYAEVEFILAEAAERGVGVSGTAESHYNAAITASFDDWGADDVATYLAQASVAYSTAEGGNHLNAIAMQKWLALYNQGNQGWIEWRRFDYPTLNLPEDLTLADVPVRFTYPANEGTLNDANLATAAAAIGGDVISTKLFWDKN